MFKKLFTAVAGLATAAVAACGEAPQVTTRYMDPTGTWDEMTAAAARGPILAAVLHQPFPDRPDDAVTTAVLERMARAVTAYDGLRFTLFPADAGHPDYRVIVAFNPPPGFVARKLCEGQVPPVERGDRIHVLAVFCEARRGVLAEVRGSVGGDDLTPEDERFGQLLSLTARALFQKEPR